VRSGPKDGLDGGPGAFERVDADRRALLREHGEHGAGSRERHQPLQAQHDLDLDARALVEGLTDVPRPVGRLRPRRPLERDVGPDARWAAFAGQAVARLPGEVAEEHVGLEMLLERLAFQQRVLERVAQCADGIGEKRGRA